MQYPINYDFSKWREEVVPHLDNPKILNAIRKGINDYLEGFPGNKKYKRNTCPANYSSRDYHCMLIDRKAELYMKQLEIEGKLPKKYLDLREKLNESSDEDFDKDDICEQLMFMEQDIQAPLYKWDNIKYDIESYFLCGGAHYFAPTFELTLAKLVEPQEHWKVRSGRDHTTVINKHHTKVFDLTYWCAVSNRLENYLFGDELEDDDPTRGGRIAFMNSM